MPWINEIELVKSVKDLKTSQSITGRVYPNFEALDARIATVLRRIANNLNFRKKILIEEQKAQKEDRYLRGRQIAHMFYEYFLIDRHSRIHP